MFDESSKNQNTLWWIASIAISVVCCASLFVLFASYLDAVKAGMQDESLRMSILEQRQDRILAEIQALREHGIPAAAVAPAPAAEAAPAATPETTTAPATAVGSSAPIPEAVKPAAPDIAVPTMPAMPATPPVPPATAAAPNKN